MIFNQRTSEPIIFTANSSKNAQGYCQTTKHSVCHNSPSDKSFSPSKNFETRPWYTYRMDFKQRQKPNEVHQKLHKNYCKDKIFKLKSVQELHRHSNKKWENLFPSQTL